MLLTNLLAVGTTRKWKDLTKYWFICLLNSIFRCFALVLRLSWIDYVACRLIFIYSKLNHAFWLPFVQLSLIRSCISSTFWTSYNNVDGWIKSHLSHLSCTVINRFVFILLIQTHMIIYLCCKKRKGQRQQMWIHSDRLKTENRILIKFY